MYRALDWQPGADRGRASVLMLVKYLGMRKSAPLSRVQQEMVATVVNGVIGGAP